MHLNRGRIWLGGLAGGVVWNLWSFGVNRFVVTDARYLAAQNAGLFLKTPRYPFSLASGSCSCLFWRSWSRTCTRGRDRPSELVPAPRSR